MVKDEFVSIKKDVLVDMVKTIQVSDKYRGFVEGMVMHNFVVEVMHTMKGSPQQPQQQQRPRQDGRFVAAPQQSQPPNMAPSPQRQRPNIQPPTPPPVAQESAEDDFSEDDEDFSEQDF